MTAYDAIRTPRDQESSGWYQIMPAPDPARPLEEDLHGDWVVVVGAGFAGLAAARRLSQLRGGDRIVVIDAEQCAMAYRLTSGPRWDDFDEAVAAIRDIGPGGHYLGHSHTQANFERAFFMPRLFDNNSFEQWTADGEKEI